MTVQPIERTDLDIIEALDWEHVPPCESRYHGSELSIHEGPAYALVRQVCTVCGRDYGVGYRCQRYVAYTTTGGALTCAPFDGGCGQRFSGGTTVIALVGGAS